MWQLLWLSWLSLSICWISKLFIKYIYISRFVVLLWAAVSLVISVYRSQLETKSSSFTSSFVFFTNSSPEVPRYIKVQPHGLMWRHGNVCVSGTWRATRTHPIMQCWEIWEALMSSDCLRGHLCVCDVLLQHRRNLCVATQLVALRECCRTLHLMCWLNEWI